MSSITQIIKSLPKYLHIQIWVQRYIDALRHDLHYSCRYNHCWFLSRNWVPSVTVLQDWVRYGEGLVYRFTLFTSFACLYSLCLYPLCYGLLPLADTHILWLVGSGVHAWIQFGMPDKLVWLCQYDSARRIGPRQFRVQSQSSIQSFGVIVGRGRIGVQGFTQSCYDTYLELITFVFLQS